MRGGAGSLSTGEESLWLGEFLGSGRIVPEIGQDEIREVIVQNYRIMYRVLPGELEILTVRHGARQVR